MRDAIGKWPESALGMAMPRRTRWVPSFPTCRGRGRAGSLLSVRGRRAHRDSRASLFGK